MWKAERWGRTWYVTRVDRGVLEYLKTAPCNGSKGRIITFRSESAAQRRADALNENLAERARDGREVEVRIRRRGVCGGARKRARSGPIDSAGERYERPDA